MPLLGFKSLAFLLITMTALSQYVLNERDFIKIYRVVEGTYEVKLPDSLLPPLFCSSDSTGVIQTTRYAPEKKEIAASQKVVIDEDLMKDECESCNITILDVLKRRFSHEYSHVAASRCAPWIVVNNVFSGIAARELDSRIGVYFDLSSPLELYKRIETSLSLDEALACAGEELTLDKLSLKHIETREKKIKIDMPKPFSCPINVDGKVFDFKGSLVNYLQEKILSAVDDDKKLPHVIRNIGTFVLEPPFLRGREDVKVIFNDE